MDGYDYTNINNPQKGPNVKIEDGENIGIVPRVIKSLFSLISETSTSSRNTYRVYGSFLQLYQEKILDLLNPTHSK